MLVRDLLLANLIGQFEPVIVYVNFSMCKFLGQQRMFLTANNNQIVKGVIPL